ncbi:calpain-9-like isoform X1 [Diadema setosum]|uniref:calpain-9-like isoform X1 n=1 Tax=Diadema setosum TaxID=31175 RepID=UPI003B3A09B7
MSKRMFRQDYSQIRKQCMSSGTLFEDPEFPAIDESIFPSQPPPRPFKWLRPNELVQNPRLFVGGASRFDVAQGELGDCWFLAAVASLSLDEYLLNKVVPNDQSFDPQRGYCGLFRFRFWHYGEWKEIVIDDRLPTYNGKLVFVHSKEQNEFWSALLEKAYSKLHGSYEALKGGNVIEAMEDFTGGVSESIDMKQNPPPGLFKILKSSYDRDSQLGCSINAKPGVTEAVLPSGLIAGHAYTITDVRKVSVRGAEKRLIRIRNPWGQKEWNGAWSDGSSEWNAIPSDQRRSLGLVTDDDGEFWMEFRDFKRHYDRVDMCHLGADTLTGKTGKRKKKWECSLHKGRWQRGASAGGCRNFPETFWINPQYKLVLEEEDDKDDIGDDEDDDPELAKKTGATFLVALMQMNRRAQRKMGVDNLTTGFAIYKTDATFDASRGLPKDHFLYNASTARSPTFTNTREVSGRFKLTPGTYCIVPSTFEPNQEGDFILRVYSMKRSSSVSVDEETCMVDIPRQPPPPQEDEQTQRFRQFFQKLTGPDMEVDAWELQEILNAALKKDFKSAELRGGGFTLESCKSMVALTDEDRSGKLGFEEFRELWQSICAWKAIFKKFDEDNSGTFNAYEMKGALRSLGFKLSANTFGCLVLRYADKSGRVTFDSFIAAAIKLKFMFMKFADAASGGRASYKLDEFLMLNLYS